MQLLADFRKFLPHEKGLILEETEKKLSELSIPESFLNKFFPEFEKLLLYQKIKVYRYLAFLVAIYEYQKELERLEWEGDAKLAQLRDERLKNIARALRLENRKGRKPKKKKKLEALKGEILALRKEGLGASVISKYLWKAHRLKVSKQYLLQLLSEWEKESGQEPA